MTSIQFVYLELTLLIALNFYILRLYKGYLFLKEAQGGEGAVFNSPSLFSRTTFDSFMLRLPIPIFSDLKYDGIQEVIRKHNMLTYVYYVLAAGLIIHVLYFT